MIKLSSNRKIKSLEQKILSGFSFLLILASFVFGCFPLGVQATVAGYTAEEVSQSFSSLNLPPGKAITFEAAFKNVGTVVWNNDDTHYVSLYVDDVGENFYHKYWLTSEQPAKMIETSAAPGEVAHFRMALAAPETLGSYSIKLKLAAENLTWIPGGAIDLPVNVTADGTPASAPADDSGSATVTTAENFQALRVIQSEEVVALAAGGSENFTVGFKNVGEAAWESDGENMVKICLPLDVATESFRDPRWLSNDCPAAVSSETPVGQIGYFNFSLSGNLGGNFKLNFILKNNDAAITGGSVILPVIVSGTLEAPVVSPDLLKQPEEPTIRIGLYATKTAETIRADIPFEVRDADGNLIFTVPAGDTVTAAFNFAAETYSATLDGVKKSGLSYLRFVSADPNTIFEITSFENRLSWNKSINNNKFRGDLELRWSDDNKKLYMINELPLESYIKGVAEVSNNTPAEYLKAMAIAMRTYAEYNLEVGGKHPAGNFHLNASSGDQVYRGYNSELTLPNFVKAVEDTRGIVVTYGGNVVMTPYFSQSDGRTRSWEEVWWGAGKPWLVSKPDPNCAGLRLRGHGVGLSAHGAYEMGKDGSNYEQILKYYYTGIDLEQIY